MPCTWLELSIVRSYLYPLIAISIHVDFFIVIQRFKWTVPKLLSILWLMSLVKKGSSSKIRRTSDFSKGLGVQLCMVLITHGFQVYVWLRMRCVTPGRIAPKVSLNERANSSHDRFRNLYLDIFHSRSCELSVFLCRRIRNRAKVSKPSYFRDSCGEAFESHKHNRHTATDYTSIKLSHTMRRY